MARIEEIAAFDPRVANMAHWWVTNHTRPHVFDRLFDGNCQCGAPEDADAHLAGTDADDRFIRVARARRLHDLISARTTGAAPLP